MHLTVIHPFSIASTKDDAGKELAAAKDYARGDKIYDEEKIAEILDGENKSHCVRTADLSDGANGKPFS
jgi:hypothetical protein